MCADWSGTAPAKSACEQFHIRAGNGVFMEVPNYCWSYLLSMSGQDATYLNAILLNRSDPDAGDCL